jgi:thioredoxin reductase (NADPH)
MLRDEEGYLVTGNQLVRDGRLPQGWMSERAPLMLETSVPRVFAAGDVRRGAVRRVASAILEGMLAITLARQVLREHAESIVGAAS